MNTLTGIALVVAAGCIVCACSQTSTEPGGGQEPDAAATAVPIEEDSDGKESPEQGADSEQGGEDSDSEGSEAEVMPDETGADESNSDADDAGAGASVVIVDAAAEEGSDEAARLKDADPEDSSELRPSCSGATEVLAGRNYGAYSVFAVRLNAGIMPGEYLLRAAKEEVGLAYVLLPDGESFAFQYDAVASLADNALQTLTIPGYFEIDLRSQTESDLSALDESILNGCHAVRVEAALPIVEGELYESYTISDLTIEPGAMSGVYTFYAESGDTGSVEVRLDGTAIDTLEYDWRVMVGAGESYTFVFAELATMTISRPMGTSNLFGLATALFDGRHELIVP